jgi:ParB/RepB/Spo0J family partition protein
MMSESTPVPYQKWEVKRIPLEKIIVPEKRLRAYRDDKEEYSLEATAKKYGIINEIGVRPLPDGNYELIYGEGRLKTLKNLGATEVDAKVWHVDDVMAIELQLMENYARGRIDPREFFMVINELFEKYGKTVDEIAELTGYSTERIEQLLRIRDADPEIKLAFLEGQISAAHVEELMKILDETKRLETLDLVLRTNMSASALREYRKHAIEGICDRCGQAKPPLIEFSGLFLCQDCLNALMGEAMRAGREEGELITCEFCRDRFPLHEISWVGICNRDLELLKTVKEYVGLTLGIDPLHVFKEHFVQFLQDLRRERGSR